MRESCLFCATKHVSQAIILVMEACQGYPDHIHLAVGHLGEAADECCSEFPQLAQHTRKVRLALMGQEGTFHHEDLMNLLKEVRKEAEKINGISELSRTQEILYKAQCDEEFKRELGHLGPFTYNSVESKGQKGGD